MLNLNITVVDFIRINIVLLKYNALYYLHRRGNPKRPNLLMGYQTMKNY